MVLAFGARGHRFESCPNLIFLPFISFFVTDFVRKTSPKGQILDFSELKVFADNKFKFDRNGRWFSIRLENTVGKGGEIARYEQFLLFPQCFQRTLILQTRKNQGLLRRGLN